MSATRTLELRQPDDFHLHLRDGDMLRAVASISAAHFGRAVIMPNLVPPITDCAGVEAYRDRIMAALPLGSSFEPLMTLYLTEATQPAEVERAAVAGLIRAVKLYPAGATTNSASGVRDMEKIFPVLERMQQLALPLLVHGEVTRRDIDIFDREQVFLEQVLEPLRQRFPALPIVLEHVTTQQGVAYVRSADSGLAATITAHHLIINRNAMLVGGIRPDYYCLPVAKRETHRQALLEAATSGDRRFFLGTDSAPHAREAKLCECGCAGIFTALNAMACITQLFDDAGALDRLEGFVSLHGADFYGLPPNRKFIRLQRESTPQLFPSVVPAGTDTVRVFDPGMDVFWQVVATMDIAG